MPATKLPDPQAVVIFGASGDLTRRKLLPAFYHLFCSRMLPESLAIVGYARTRMTDDEFRERARKSLQRYARTDPEGEDWEEFSRRLSYVAGEFENERCMEHLARYLEDVDGRFGTEGRRFHYCATPPSAFPEVVARLGESGMQHRAKIVIEKPFGRDVASARELNQQVHEVFDESQVFRIDHYLGKETVQNLLAFRFSNGMFEPIWNRQHIDNVQITAAESIGVEGRGGFYEQTGAIRDIIVTHLFQILTFFAMEPPVSFAPERLRDEKARVLRSMRPLDPTRVVRGQYRGYREEEGVAPDSRVETFAAMAVEIDNWRWAGVPFYLRSGKRLKRKVTEVSVSFKEVPYNVFRETPDFDDHEGLPAGRDALVFRVQPNEGISLELNIKRPGLGWELDRAVLDFGYEAAYETPLVEAYEHLLLEAMEGDHSLFPRQDGIERAWEVLTPVLDDPPPLVEYEAESWGPEEADVLVLPNHWHVSPVPEQGRQGLTG